MLKAIRQLEFVLDLNPSSWKKLWLPSVFTHALIRQALSNVMLCEASNDQPWMPVATEVDDSGYMYFSTGWPEFVRAYRIGPLDWLEFRYLGDHRFTVRVYETTGLRCRYSAWVDGVAMEQFLPGCGPSEVSAP